MALQLLSEPTCVGTPEAVVFPLPNCPRVFWPQIQSVPSVFNATACAKPADIVFQFVAVPIFRGVLLLVMVPSPNCPLALMPQPHKVPSCLIANVWWSFPAVALLKQAGAVACAVPNDPP